MHTEQSLTEVFEQQHYTTYLKHVDELLTYLAEQREWEQFVAHVLRKVSVYISFNNKLAAARLLEDHQLLIKNYSTTKQQIVYYHLLASAHEEVGSDEKVFSYLQKAKQLAEMYAESTLLPRIYYQLSVFYRKQQNIDQSFAYADLSVHATMDDMTYEAIRSKLHYAQLLLARGDMRKANELVTACEHALQKRPIRNETIYLWQVKAYIIEAIDDAAEAYTFLQKKLSFIAEHSKWCDMLYETICAFSKKSQPAATYIEDLEHAMTIKGRVLTLQNVEQIELLEAYFDDMNVKRLAWTDTLTQLPNRRYLEDIFPKLAPPYTAFLFDVDSFKGINDSAGHLVGDEVLKRIVTSIQQEIQHESIHFVRLGGDEFFGIMPGDIEYPTIMAEKMLLAVRNIHITHQAVTIRPTISIGLCHILQPQSLERVMQLADEALYQAKAQGKNQYVFIHEVTYD